MRKIVMFLCGLTAIVSCVKAGQPRLEYFPLSAVELLESRFRRAQQLNVEYLLALEPDRLLAPFLREAGLEPRAESYTNWENTGLDGHIGGHYVAALSLMYASTGDERIGQRLEYMLSELRRAQQANGDGYIAGIPGGKNVWEEIRRGDIRAGGFSLNGKWVPLYNIHKTYAGLRDAWIHTGNELARSMLVELTDWMAGVVDGLADEQMQDMLRSEHGGLNETFADVAAITGEDKYLFMAERFSHRAILDPLMEGVDVLTGKHANTQIPKVLGYKRIADLKGNEAWNVAARFFWQTVVHNRSVNIGGNSVREHFHPTDDFSLMTSSEEGPETCNTYNMLRLTGMLFATEPSSTYMDYYEQGLYNHILSTQNPHTGGYVYFTPMRPAHYRVYSQPQTSMWCCVGSGMENHSKYGEAIYAKSGDELYVNLFIPSRLRWEEKGVEITQQNSFPAEGSTNFVIKPAEPLRFALKVRWPGWADGVKAMVNGRPISISKGADGYIKIDRLWSPDDTVDIDFEMGLRVESLPDGSPYRSISYGPVVLAARWNDYAMTGLFADDSRGGHIAHGPHIPSSEIPVLPDDENAIISSITPTAKPLHFDISIGGRIFILEPFYSLHESRYIIYWPTSSDAVAGEWEELQRSTVDVVYCGQQQPESDHGIESEDSEAGYSDGYHWRQASQWFSYSLLNDGGEAARLRITSLPATDNEGFSVMFNGNIAATGGNISKPGELYVIEIPIPAGIPVLDIRITGEPVTPRITEIRVLK